MPGVRQSVLGMGLFLAAYLGAPANAQVQHGAIGVTENDANNTPASVSLVRLGGNGPWTIVSNSGGDSSNRGDYVIDLGPGQNTTTGILIASVYEGGRTEPSVSYEPYFATSACERSSSTSRYFLSVFDTPGGGEVNFNPSFAYFPLADGWLAGAAYNSANNGPLTSLVGTWGLALRTEGTATGTGYELIDETGTNGFYTLRLEGLDLRRDGVLLVGAAKNEDNRAAVSLQYDGSAIINCIDNGSEDGGENDPVAFVLIPEGTPGVVMGTITGSGRALFSQGDFSVDLGKPALSGTFRITIPGENPATGTLIACPHSELSGTTVDNPIFVIPTADGWLIETRDIEPLPTGLQLQDLAAGDIAFDFAFFKNGVNIQPAAPPQTWKTQLNDIVAARFHTTEIRSSNNLGDMRCERSAGSDALDVFADNRGDVGISYLRTRPVAYANGDDMAEGVMLGCPTQFARNNSPTGGASGWTTFSYDDAQVRTFSANTGGEINSDFALAFFPKSLGLQMGTDLPAHNGTIALQSAGDATTDGVLLAVNWNNDNRVVAATPVAAQYVVKFYDGASGAEVTSGTELGYVLLPYTLPDLIAGQIDAQGNIISGTGEFTTGLGQSSLNFPVTRITIPGVDANNDGVLILTGTGGPYALAWEPAPDGAFEVAGLNLVNDVRGRAAFAFAYIPYESACPNCIGELTGDCQIDLVDAATLAAHLGQRAGEGYHSGDLNSDGRIDLRDFARLQDVFGRDCEVPDRGPTVPTLLTPASGATIFGGTALLKAEVSDPDGDPVQVTFYGRAVVPNTALPFTVVALPDTQFYSQDYPQLFTAQTQWIINNRDALNIVAVLHLGDIVNTSTKIVQWQAADAALSILDLVPALPYGLAVGNHDQEPCCGGSPGGTTNFNTFFPYTRYEGVSPWYGGHYANKNDNNYITFSGGGMDFIAVQMEFDTSANPAVLAWADDVIASHPDHRAIAVTHWMVNTGYPASFSNQGQQIYNKLRHNPNLFLLHGGHIAGEGRRTDTYAGRTVYSLLADYQSRTNGGNGWLRIMEFRPAENVIEVTTYSPYLNQFEEDADSHFTLPYDMGSGTFVPLTTATVPSGTTVNYAWESLEPGPHEWYVTAENEGGQNASDVRRFQAQ